MEMVLNKKQSEILEIPVIYDLIALRRIISFDKAMKEFSYNENQFPHLPLIYNLISQNEVDLDLRDIEVVKIPLIAHMIISEQITFKGVIKLNLTQEQQNIIKNQGIVNAIYGRYLTFEEALGLNLTEKALNFFEKEENFQPILNKLSRHHDEILREVTAINPAFTENHLKEYADALMRKSKARVRALTTAITSPEQLEQVLKHLKEEIKTMLLDNTTHRFTMWNNKQSSSKESMDIDLDFENRSYKNS